MASRKFCKFIFKFNTTLSFNVLFENFLVYTKKVVVFNEETIKFDIKSCNF